MKKKYNSVLTYRKSMNKNLSAIFGRGKIKNYTPNFMNQKKRNNYIVNYMNKKDFFYY